MASLQSMPGASCWLSAAPAVSLRPQPPAYAPGHQPIRSAVTAHAQLPAYAPATGSRNQPQPHTPLAANNNPRRRKCPPFTKAQYKT